MDLAHALELVVTSEADSDFTSIDELVIHIIDTLQLPETADELAPGATLLEDDGSTVASAYRAILEAATTTATQEITANASADVRVAFENR